MLGLAESATAWLRALPVWAGFLVLTTASFLATWVVAVFGARVVRRAVQRTHTDVDAVLYRELRLPVFVTVALLGVYAAAVTLSVSPLTHYVLAATAKSIVLLAWSRTLVRLGDHVIENVGNNTPVASDFAPIFENLWTFLVIAGTVLLLLTVWHVDVTPLLASAGVAGVALGFAARDAVANFFGSIALYFDDTYTVGDYVVLEDSDMEGTVLDVSIRSTRLLTREDVIITVPNSILNAAKIVNRSDPDPRTRLTLDIGVAYDTDLDHFEAVVLDVARDEHLVLDTPSPRMRLREFGPSALDYELRCWVRSPLSDERAAHRLLRRIHQRLEAENITLSYPTRTVRLDDAAATDDHPLPDAD